MRLPEDVLLLINFQCELQLTAQPLTYMQILHAETSCTETIVPSDVRRK